jgi:hypothetical protein
MKTTLLAYNPRFGEVAAQRAFAPASGLPGYDRQDRGGTGGRYGVLAVTRSSRAMPVLFVEQISTSKARGPTCTGRLTLPRLRPDCLKRFL